MRKKLNAFCLTLETPYSFFITLTFLFKHGPNVINFIW